LPPSSRPVLFHSLSRPTQHLRRAGAEQYLIAVNLSNTPLQGTLEADAGNWKEIELPISKPEVVAIPFVSLNAFGARIFQNQTR
jgi:hypothetical protein